jgi:hypothetical protein
MKRFLIVGAISVVLFLSCMTPQKVSQEDSTCFETVNVSGVQKDELFTRINFWCAETFKGPEANFNVPEKSRVISTDRDQGIIRANNTIITNWGPVSGGWLALVYSNIAIYVSDGQYRLVFTAASMQAVGVVQDQVRYTKKGPVDGRVIEVTRTTWQNLTEALRDTVSGTLAGN